MNHALSFDTLAYAKKLALHGVETTQAEGHAEALSEIVELSLVTKKEQQMMTDTLSQQMDVLGLKLRAEMSELRTELKTEMAELRTEMAELKSELKIEISAFKSEMKSDMANLKFDLVKWVLGIAFGQAALIISMFKILH